MHRRISLAVLAQVAGSTLALTAAADTIRVVPLTTNRIAYNPVDGMIYATTPDTNSVTIVDPIAGTVRASIVVGNEPFQLAVSNTGRYIYVGLKADAAVRRIDAFTQIADLQFLVGVDLSSGRTMYVEDMEVMPGNEDAVAISRLGPGHMGVAIYDSGIRRSGTTPDHPNGANAIAWSQSAGTLYGYNNASSGFGTYGLSVTASGVSIAQTTSGLISGYSIDIKYGNGFLYSHARKVDAATMTVAGNFPSVGATGLVEPDPGGGRLFTLSGGRPRVLRAYDLDTLTEVGTLDIPLHISTLLPPPFISDLVRWGDDGLAFRTDAGQLFLVNTSLVAPSATGACCLMDGTCTVLTLPVCSAAAGLWRGQNTECAAAACLQPGACCMADGSCLFVFESACGGMWQGAGVTCAAANCPLPPTGACCLLNGGGCLIVWAGECVVQGGLYRGDGTPCGSPTCGFYVEIEPNASKAEANAVILGNGQALAGVTTGANDTPGNTDPTTVDYFRVKTTPAAPGIYRHRLILNSYTAAHLAWIRGISQGGAVAAGPWPCATGTPGTSENNGQTSRVDGADRVSTWYGFGREEEVYYRVRGTAGTSSPYAATLETSPVTPVDLGTFSAGVITISTVGQVHANDTHLRIYDGQFDPIPGYANDGASTNGGAQASSQTASFLRREYSTGTYYMGITIGNLATNQGAPCDDSVRNGTMMDFPNVAVDTGNSTRTDLSFTITDSLGTTTVPASRSGHGEVAWFKFTVGSTPSCYTNCDGSTAPPVLNVADFTCFLVKFAGQDSYANCDQSTTVPVLNVADFTCFLQKFAAGCP